VDHPVGNILPRPGVQRSDDTNIFVDGYDVEFLNSKNPIRREIAGKAAGTYFAVVVLAALLASGCSQTLRVEQANIGERVDVDTFLHEHLLVQPMVTVSEAYRAMLILADGDDTCKSFGERRSLLEERGIARGQWDLRREACIDRGSIAYMVCKILKVRGGINLTIFGSLGIGDRRYAMRELMDMSMMEYGSVDQYMTGGELVTLIGKADRYMADHGMYEEEAVDIVETLETESVKAAKP